MFYVNFYCIGMTWYVRHEGSVMLLLHWLYCARFTTLFYVYRVVRMLQHDDSEDALQGSQEQKLQFSFIKDFVDNPSMKVNSKELAR